MLRSRGLLVCLALAGGSLSFARQSEDVRIPRQPPGSQPSRERDQLVVDILHSHETSLVWLRHATVRGRSKTVARYAPEGPLSGSSESNYLYVGQDPLYSCGREYRSVATNARVKQVPIDSHVKQFWRFDGVRMLQWSMEADAEKPSYVSVCEPDEEDRFASEMASGIDQGPLSGRLWSENGQPLWLVIATASTRSVSPSLELVGQFKCVKVTATGDFGDLSVWFAVDCDHSIVKTLLRKGADHHYLGAPLREHHYPHSSNATQEYVEELTDVSLSNVQERWIARSGTFRSTMTFDDGHTDELVITLARDEIVLGSKGASPDPNIPPIPDGTPVYFGTVEQARARGGIDYEWRDGDVRPIQDKALLEHLRETAPGLARSRDATASVSNHSAFKAWAISGLAAAIIAAIAWGSLRLRARSGAQESSDV